MTRLPYSRPVAAGPEVGLLVPGSLPWTEVVGWAGRAEEAGAARVWVGPARGASIVLAGAVGRRTSLRVGVVVPVGEVAATVMAKHLNSLDVVIGGRLDVALLGTPDEVTQTAGVMRAMASGQAVSGGARALPAAVQQPG